MDTNSRPLAVEVASGDVAIVGMSCLFPGASDLNAYWKNILSKVDAISDPPLDAWDPSRYYDPTANSNDRVYCKRGGYIGDIASFRPTDFGVMPANVEGGEPDQWLSLQLAYAAMDDAGYTGTPPEHLLTEVILGKGTYINRGNLTVGYHGWVVEQVLQILRNLHPEYSDADIDAIKTELKAGLPPFSADTAPALIGNIIAGRVANRLDLMGPSFTVDGACASALLAVEIGVRDLLTRKCDLVIAGGANVNLPLPTQILFCQLNALSRKERIRPFDKDADGTLLGEGIGMVVLKRLDDARAANDRIYAVIKGVGSASDGRGQHVMAPRVEGEELALRRAYTMAGVAPQTVGLIEAHGTATPVGDATEVKALRSVFGDRVGVLPSCALGSVKSMIGHTMPAAGIAGLIKTALALYHRVLPPTINCDEPDPSFGLEQSPFYVNTEARPWIHGSNQPRRAGVNAFGFGGINGHVVLEENCDDAHGQLPAHLLDWDTEVCVLYAPTRRELVRKASKLIDFLESCDTFCLKDLAYSLSKQQGVGASILSIVATSGADLAGKLNRAVDRLADPACRQIKDNKGIYFFEEPLSKDGKLALMFPGEGAQYPNMLADLCIHFPEVRECFDLADRAFADHPRGYLPSDFIFPRAIVSEAERSSMGERLWRIDGAVEAVLIANRAMWTLLERLELHADVIVGHSTGDYSAMFASGVIPLTHEASYVETIRLWDQAHEVLARRYTVPNASLVAVAASTATVMSILEGLGDELSVAMENCPHQNVIVGSDSAIEKAIGLLKARGVIYERLTFDRPYHTPIFADYAEGVGNEFFSRLPISPPNIDVYSCTTAAPYPSDPELIRDLFVKHWIEPVRFSETVERMYADGVRLFVESGPRNNLTAFVGDILRGRPHLAVPANVAARSGITQLNHLVGILSAQGVRLNAGYLYARRSPRPLEWEDVEKQERRRPPSIKLLTGMPNLSVKPRRPKTAASARKVKQTQPAQASEPGGSVPVRPAAAHASRVEEKNVVDRPTVGRHDVMQQHLSGMNEFLSVQHSVMQAFLRRCSYGGTGAAASPQACDLAEFPLLGEVVSLQPGKELVAVRSVSRVYDKFLDDHALGGQISVNDPQLKPLVVVPLTISMEILAEAAAALVGSESIVVGMRDITAGRWIRVDEEPIALRIVANRLEQDTVDVRVFLGSSEQSAQGPVVRGLVEIAPAYSSARPSPLQLADARSSALATADLYDGRLMFHGPCFRGVSSLSQSGSDGMVGELRVLPAGQLFQSNHNPRFVTDPVLLDAAGQLVGFWAREYLPSGFVVFPYRVKQLRIYGPKHGQGVRCQCRLRVELLGNDRMRSDLEILNPDGSLWMQLQGWEDMRFDPPPPFHRFWVSPLSPICESWTAPVAHLPADSQVACCRLDRLFDTQLEFWGDLWSSLVLTRLERQAFREVSAAAGRQHEWLSGRTAAKDAVRELVRRQVGVDLLPADIQIRQDSYGRPFLDGHWLQDLPAVPQISLAHSKGTAVAVAAMLPEGARLGVDIELLRDLPDVVEATAFSPDEQDLYGGLSSSLQAEWRLRAWCAKEAVGKALGRGLLEGPASVKIVSLDPEEGLVEVCISGKLLAEFPELANIELAVYTARDGDFVTALTFCERKV